MHAPAWGSAGTACFAAGGDASPRNAESPPGAPGAGARADGCSRPAHSIPAVLNWAGSMLAIAGTGLYSAAKQKASNDAKKAKAA